MADRHYGNGLPPGWFWADWEGQAAALAAWGALSAPVRGSFQARFEGIQAGLATGRLLHHSKFYIEKGSSVGVAKVDVDNPGWRAGVFRIGQAWYVSHITRKDPKEKSHRKIIETAERAMNQHLLRHPRK